MSVKCAERKVWNVLSSCAAALVTWRRPPVLSSSPFLPLIHASTPKLSPWHYHSSHIDNGINITQVRHSTGGQSHVGGAKGVGEEPVVMKETSVVGFKKKWEAVLRKRGIPEPSWSVRWIVDHVMKREISVRNTLHNMCEVCAT